MSEANGASSAELKKRGVGFPQMSLQDAVDAIVVVGQNGRDHTKDAFAAYLGHSTANSGAFRAKLASLRDWGLIARGDKDRVVLSGLAQELVLAAPDHSEVKALLLQAFESCRIFGMLHADSAKNVPLDLSRLRATALMRFGVAADQGDAFVDSFVKSAVFVGIAESDGAKVTLLAREAALSADVMPRSADDGGEATPQGSAVDAGTAPPSVAVTTMPGRSSAVPVALRQAWEIDGGEIEFVIRTPKPLPPQIYQLMAEMAGVASRMQTLVGTPHDRGGDTDATELA